MLYTGKKGDLKLCSLDIYFHGDSLQLSQSTLYRFPIRETNKNNEKLGNYWSIVVYRNNPKLGLRIFKVAYIKADKHRVYIL